MKHPEKIPFFEYYLQPIFDTVIWVTDAIGQALSEEALSVRDDLRRLAGCWYCGYCKKYHSGRIRKLHSADAFNFNEWCSLAHEDREGQEDDT